MSVNYLGMIISFFGFFTGIKFPDWDFLFRLRHRSILTHSPILSIGLIFTYYTRLEDSLFAYLIASFSFGVMVHMIFDIFPHGWGSGSLLKIPFGRTTCSPKTTRYFFLVTIVLEFFVVLIFLNQRKEYLIYSIFGLLYMLYKVPKERKFWRPVSFYLIFICLGYLNFIDITLK